MYGRRSQRLRLLRAEAIVAATIALAVAGAVLASGSINRIDGPAASGQVADRGSQVPVGPTTPAPPTSANYRVTLVVEWSQSTHPSTLPVGWHTSPAVLAAHRSPGDVFATGNAASAGIEQMAETGGTSILVGELSANPSVAEFDRGSGIDGAGQDTLEVTASGESGLLSFVTMLAPSPDWFVGFEAVPVFLGDRWEDRLVLDLVPYDAGSDSGATFTAGDIDTQPPQPVTGPVDPQYVTAAAEHRFGYAVIERVG